MKNTSVNERLEQVLFYTLEKSIKSYRQFAQRRINKLDRDITIDQWLTLKTLDDHPGIAQKEIASRVFKDQASITRIIDALVQKGYLQRKDHEQDRRRFSLVLSPLGEMVLAELDPIIKENRNTALQGLSITEVRKLRTHLEQIIQNCTT